MNVQKLKNHIKLCQKNLKSNRVKCCTECPFEEEILTHYPDLNKLFLTKRLALKHLRKSDDS